MALPRGTLRFLIPAPFVIAAIAAAVWFTAFGGSAGPTPTPSPSPSPSPTPGPTEPPTPTPVPPETAFRFVYREFGQTQDVIWRLNPLDPAAREQLAVIPHREGWGVKPSLSPDQELLAYVTMPEPAIDPSFQAELYIMDLKTGESEFITGAVDLTFTPLWTPDGRILYARRYAKNDVVILQVKVQRPPKPGERTPAPTPEPSPGETPAPTPDPVQIVIQDSVFHALSFTPVGFDDEKSMFVVQIQGGTGGGSLLTLFSPATYDAVIGAEEQQRAYDEAVQFALENNLPLPAPTPIPTPRVKLVAQLSDQIARDYSLSPDAQKFAFVVQQLVEGQFVSQAMITDIPSAQTAPVTAEGLPAGEHVSPLWHPDSGRVALGVIPADGTPGRVALIPAGGGPAEFLPGPAQGFDVPKAWSPDGAYLAVVNFTGSSLANPGTARLELVAPTGQRINLGEGVDVEILGWFQPPPPPP